MSYYIYFGNYRVLPYYLCEISETNFRASRDPSALENIHYTKRNEQALKLKECVKHSKPLAFYLLAICLKYQSININIIINNNNNNNNNLPTLRSQLLARPYFSLSP